MKTASQRIAAIRAAEKRFHEICRLKAAGLSLAKIGHKYGITKQRVHQILQAER